MGVKIFKLSNECKNILVIIWVKKYFRCQMRIKKF